ncbi:MAG TPA: wax ester/triacylglycerol synthase family O-acyltransferase [Acidimicrobiales bacterium]|nr:wax ester/triacylglycerol synthase family O-acyltransferase [Acidimicrobiales bacterium]
MESLSGIDAAFLAMETPTSRLHVAGVLVLDPPERDGERSGGPDLPTVGFDAIRRVVGERVERVPRLSRRAVRRPLDLQRPVWVECEEIDLDTHVTRRVVAPPGGRRELDALVGELLSRPLPISGPLWEMVVAEGVADGRTAVVARLHHAVLDGVSGASAMAAFLDVSPRAPGESGTLTLRGSPRSSLPFARPGTIVTSWDAPGAASPSSIGLVRDAAASFARQAAALIPLVERSTDALVAIGRHNKELAACGLSPPPAPFSAPRTSLNGNVTAQRRIATLAVPLADLELVRRVLGSGTDAEGSPRGATVNDVILCAVGGALGRYLDAREEAPSRPLVALVPVSTRDRATVPAPSRAHVGNYVSGMLVPLATNVVDPVARLRTVAVAAEVAKVQEDRAGGELLETFLRAIPPLLVSASFRAAAQLSLFDRVAPPANVVVSSIVVPDVSLWWAGHRVSAIYPAGPVADGIGLNVTSMTYRGTVHFGIVSCPRLVPDVEELSVLLDDAIAELVAAALDGA